MLVCDWRTELSIISWFRQEEWGGVLQIELLLGNRGRLRSRRGDGREDE